MKSTKIPPTDAVAYSYVRFSSKRQEQGDSTRRQDTGAREWCERHGIRLDDSTKLRDLGKSAFTGTHRKNPERNDLARFLKLVEDRKVPRGAYLIVENLDRLSREHIRPALTLLLNLIEAGVRVVQLKPVEQVFDDDVEPMVLLMAVMELSRGHGESAIKSERVGKAWAEKKRRARETGEVLTEKIPSWLEIRGGKFHLVPERAAAVREIFRLANSGYGLTAIVRKLIQDKIATFGGKHWCRSFVGLVLRDRRAVGEFQPRKTDGSPDGPPIANYYPPVVSEAEWLTARAGAAERRKRPGRPGSEINLFAGLLRDARDNSSMLAVTRVERPVGGRPSVVHRSLVNAAAFAGRGKAPSFPLETLERAVLATLAEIKPVDVIGSEDGPDPVTVLQKELAAVESRIAELGAELLDGPVAEIAKALRGLEARKDEIDDLIRDATQEASRPLPEAWSATQSLLKMLDDAADENDARLRLRSALRRIVSGIWMIVVPRGRDRFCAVQIWFAGGEKCRTVEILHRPAMGNASARRQGRWWASTSRIYSGPEVIDFRIPGAAEKELPHLLEFNPGWACGGDCEDDPETLNIYDMTEGFGEGRDIDPDPARKCLRHDFKRARGKK